MKVVAVNGSRRKKNTYGLLIQVAELLQGQGVETEIINLRDYQIEQCHGCEACLKSGRCGIDDDIPKLMAKLINSDGVILSSPVYMSNVSGTFKVFIDRLCHWYHRPQLVGKPVMFVATTAGASLGYIQKYMEKAAIGIGLHPTDKISKTVRELDKKVKFQDIKNFSVHLFNDKMLYKPTLNQIINFNVQKVLAMAVLKEDKVYWKQKGWDTAPFYYDCSVGVWKKAVGTLFYNMLFGVISKERKKMDKMKKGK